MAAVVGEASESIAAVIDAVVAHLTGDGRLIYAGAGSSGRIAALDAGECEATFSTEPGQVIALVAGDGLSSPLEQEAAEDDGDAGRQAVSSLGVSERDVVVGISASGRTPYMLGALEAARGAGATTACVVSVPDSPLARARPSRDRGCRRPGVRRRLDPAQGRDGTEARPEHDLDRGDDSPREDLRRPDGRRARLQREARGEGAQDRPSRDGRLPRRGGAGPRGGRRQREGSDRLAARRPGRRRRTGSTRRCRRRHPIGARPMRLGVEAAFVGGQIVPGGIVPGDVEVVDGVITAYGLANGNGRGLAVPGFIDLQVNGFAGSRPGRRGRRRLPARRRGAAGDRRQRLPPHLHLRARGATGSPPCAGCPSTPAAPGSSASTSRARSSPRSGSGSIHPTARRDPDPALLERLLAAGPVRLMTLAPELDGAGELIDLPAGSRGHGLVRAQRRDRRAGDGGVRPRRPHGHAPVQRDAALRPPRSRPGRGGALARGRRRPDHPRRSAPGRRDGQRRVAVGRGACGAGDGFRRGSRARGRRVSARRLRDRGTGRRRAWAERRPRRQLADDDRGRPQPPCARGSARRSPSCGEQRPRAGHRPAHPRPARRRACPRTSSCSTTTSRSSRVFIGGEARVVA